MGRESGRLALLEALCGGAVFLAVAAWLLLLWSWVAS